MQLGKPTQIKIAFAGQMRSGKDTCGDYVIKTYGGVSKKFAAPLYDILAFAQQRCHLQQSKDRFFLQWLGTEWGRDTIDQNLWVNILAQEVAALGPDMNVIITDARFVNEFETLKKSGFLLVKIVRPDSERNAAEAGGITQPAATHASERDMLTYNGFDLIINNNGTLEHLYDIVDSMIYSNFNATKLADRTRHTDIQIAEDAALLDMMRRRDAAYQALVDGAHPI